MAATFASTKAGVSLEGLGSFEIVAQFSAQLTRAENNDRCRITSVSIQFGPTYYRAIDVESRAWTRGYDDKGKNLRAVPTTVGVKMRVLDGHFHITEIDLFLDGNWLPVLGFTPED